MRTAVITIVAVVLGGLGSYLVLEPPGEERLSAAEEREARESLAESKQGELSRARDAIQQPLSALKVHLRNCRESHGRYPSTDEGLAALDNFTTRVKIRMYRHAPWNSNAEELIEYYLQANRRLDRRQGFRVAPCVIGVMLLLASVAWIWRQVPRAGRIHAAGCLVASVVMIGLWRWESLQTRIFCYAVSNILRRNPVAISRRRELLDKYRAGGAISDETYLKSLASMGLKPED